MTLDQRKMLTLKDLRFNPPQINQERLSDFVKKTYGKTGPLKYLKGERDQNHQLTTEDGRQFVLKIAGADEDASIVDFQVQALLHVEKTDPELNIPRIIPTLEGAPTAQIMDVDGLRHEARLLSYVQGVPLGGEAAPCLKTLKDIGAFQGKLCKALKDFQHPASNHFMPWDISNGLVLNPSLANGKTDDIEQLVVPLLDHFKDIVLPTMKTLRRQVIHNDGHQGNLLKSAPGVDDFVGAIDFGDLICAPLIDDLAVSMDSFMPGSADPVAVGAALVSGFNEQYPLQKQEIEILYDVCLLRGALTVQLYDFRIRHSETENLEDQKDYPKNVSDLKYNLAIKGDEATARWLQVCNF